MSDADYNVRVTATDETKQAFESAARNATDASKMINTQFANLTQSVDKQTAAIEKLAKKAAGKGDEDLSGAFGAAGKSVEGFSDGLKKALSPAVVIAFVEKSIEAFGAMEDMQNRMIATGKVNKQQSEEVLKVLKEIAIFTGQSRDVVGDHYTQVLQNNEKLIGSLKDMELYAKMAKIPFQAALDVGQAAVSGGLDPKDLPQYYARLAQGVEVSGKATATATTAALDRLKSLQLIGPEMEKQVTSVIAATTSASVTPEKAASNLATVMERLYHKTPGSPLANLGVEFQQLTDHVIDFDKFADIALQKYGPGNPAFKSLFQSDEIGREWIQNLAEAKSSGKLQEAAKDVQTLENWPMYKASQTKMLNEVKVEVSEVADEVGKMVNAGAILKDLSSGIHALTLAIREFNALDTNMSSIMGTGAQIMTGKRGTRNMPITTPQPSGMPNIGPGGGAGGGGGSGLPRIPVPPQPQRFSGGGGGSGPGPGSRPDALGVGGWPSSSNIDDRRNQSPYTGNGSGPGGGQQYFTGSGGSQQAAVTAMQTANDADVHAMAMRGESGGAGAGGYGWPGATQGGPGDAGGGGGGSGWGPGGGHGGAGYGYGGFRPGVGGASGRPGGVGGRRTGPGSSSPSSSGPGPGPGSTDSTGRPTTLAWPANAPAGKIAGTTTATGYGRDEQMTPHPGGSSTTTVTGSQTLKEARAAMFRQMDADPKLKNDVMRAIRAENNNPQPVLEAFANRYAADKSSSVYSALHGGFFGPVNRNSDRYRSPLSGEEEKAGLAAYEAVKSGSNMIDYRTDQGMWQPGHYEHPYAKQVGAEAARLKQIGGEWFSDMGPGQRAWANRMRAGGGETTTTTTGGGWQQQAGTLPWPGEAASTAGDSTTTPGDARASQVGNYHNIGGRLGANRQAQYEAGQFASKYLPQGYRVEAYSGQREGGNGGPHSYASAIDWRIVGPNGPIGNYQNPENYGIYQSFHQDIHKYLADNHPELAAQHRWGGGFGGQLGKNPATGKDYVYGAMDLMHGDFAGGEGRMAAGTWSGGYRGNQPWGNIRTTGGMGDIRKYKYGSGYRAIGMTPGTGEATAKAKDDPTAGAIPNKYSIAPQGGGGGGPQTGERSADSPDPDDPKKPPAEENHTQLENVRRQREALSKPIKTTMNVTHPRQHEKTAPPDRHNSRIASMSQSRHDRHRHGGDIGYA